jgi:hypothetical protein
MVEELLAKLVFPTEDPIVRIARQEARWTREGLIAQTVHQSHPTPWARTQDGRFRERRKKS